MDMNFPSFEDWIKEHNDDGGLVSTILHKEYEKKYGQIELNHYLIYLYNAEKMEWINGVNRKVIMADVIDCSISADESTSKSLLRRIINKAVDSGEMLKLLDADDVPDYHCYRMVVDHFFDVLIPDIEAFLKK